MSELRATTISDTAGTGPVTLTGQSAAKAWLKYDAGAQTVDNDYNVSSVTDSNPGISDISYTNNFLGNEYSTVVASQRTGVAVSAISGNSGSTSGITAATSTSGNFDVSGGSDAEVCTAHFGDLA